jgi:hypothetical protein
MLIIPEKNVVYNYKSPMKAIFGFQIEENKYCAVYEIYYDSNKNYENLVIMNENGKKLHKSHIGRGITCVQTIKKHEIWVSYNDTGVFSGIFIGNDFIENSIEKYGLNCFDQFGNIIYSYTDEPNIVDCNSINVISESEVMINIYDGSKGYSFRHIVNGKEVKIIDWTCIKVFAYCDSKILLPNDENNKPKSEFTLFDVKESLETIEAFDFFDKEENRLDCIGGQKDMLIFRGKDKIFKVSIKELL